MCESCCFETVHIKAIRRGIYLFGFKIIYACIWFVCQLGKTILLCKPCNPPLLHFYIQVSEQSDCAISSCKHIYNQYCLFIWLIKFLAPMSALQLKGEKQCTEAWFGKCCPIAQKPLLCHGFRQGYRYSYSDPVLCSVKLVLKI